MHRFFLPPPALPGFSARYEATDKLSVLPRAPSSRCSASNVIHTGGEGRGKDREGRSEERQHEISDAPSKRRPPRTFTSFPPRSRESFPSFSPFRLGRLSLPPDLSDIELLFLSNPWTDGISYPGTHTDHRIHPIFHILRALYIHASISIFRFPLPPPPSLVIPRGASRLANRAWDK